MNGDEECRGEHGLGMGIKEEWRKACDKKRLVDSQKP